MSCQACCVHICCCHVSRQPCYMHNISYCQHELLAAATAICAGMIMPKFMHIRQWLHDAQYMSYIVQEVLVLTIIPPKFFIQSGGRSEAGVIICVIMQWLVDPRNPANVFKPAPTKRSRAEPKSPASSPKISSQSEQASY